MRRSMLTLVTALVIGAAGAPPALAFVHIKGKVTAAAGGAAVPRYQVDIYTAAGTLDTVACTAADGTYDVFLDPGTYTVSFYGLGHDGGCGPANTPYAPVWWSDAGAVLTRGEATEISLADGQERTGVDVALAASASVSGTVTRAGTSNAIRNVTVRFRSLAGFTVREFCTDAAGTFAGTRMAPAGYFVQFVHNGSCGNAGPYLDQFYGGATNEDDSTLVSLSAGGNRTGVDAALIASSHALNIGRGGTGSGTVYGDNGLNCASACTRVLDHGDTVTLNAQPDPGSAFEGWSGDCTGTGACTLRMDGDHTVSAMFVSTGAGDPLAPKPLAVTVAGTGAGTVTSAPAGVNCAASCAVNLSAFAIYTLHAMPAAGSRFDGWSGACSGTGTCSVTMSDARAVTATFTALPATGGPPVAASPTLVDRIAPVVTALRLSPKRIGRRGAKLQFTLSEAAKVAITVTKGKRKLGTLTKSLAAGANAIKLSKRIGRRTLRPGTYRITVVATDSTGNRSRPQSLRVTVGA
jgi:hypothetical protein